MQELSTKLYGGLGTFRDVYKYTQKRYVYFVSGFLSSSNRSIATKFVNGNFLMSCMTMKKDYYQHNG